uniref:Serine/threonine-protein kinase receptor n=1 Tax=Romanomermis culicivorax TaxID=13658 RepID=A0A915IBA4_ROMCU
QLKETSRSGTPPPIKRVQTNFSCESTKCESCNSEVQQCSYLEEEEKHACFVVWSTSRKNGTTILYRGCWPAHEKLELCANNNGTRCVSGRPHPWSDGRGEDVYFCCCETEMCNKNFEYDPKAESLDAKRLVPNILNENQSARLKTNRTVSVSPNINNNINGVIYVFASILAFVILSIIIYFAYRKFRQRFYSHYDHTHKHRFGALSSCYSLLFGAGKKQNDDKNDYGEAISLNMPEIELGEVISRGRYSQVYVAKYKTANCTVAVKVFPTQHVQSWMDECAVCKIPAMRQCKNILHFIDMDVRRTKNAPDEYWLIAEYHKNGSIFDFLKSHTITFTELLHISKTMLTGLAFLHEERGTKDDDSDKPTISDLTACIADFGLALQCERDHMPNKTHNQVGTYSYMAPEVLESALEYSVLAFKQVDVYAAALVLWELLSRCDFGNEIPSLS